MVKSAFCLDPFCFAAVLGVGARRKAAGWRFSLECTRIPLLERMNWALTARAEGYTWRMDEPGAQGDDCEQIVAQKRTHLVMIMRGLLRFIRYSGGRGLLLSELKIETELGRTARRRARV